ncbi:YqgQ family protein [Alteribacillus persepolensis]|uniref:YqgQ family protein n=1 Tax=Alteribacillus persepolensis TaxID=568899 RepID=UPI000B87C3D8|nr:YqgQ family protein [Alteribacillus persepolensis]
MYTTFHSIADIRKWLMQFNIVVYTKDKRTDLELMEGEIKEAYQSGLLDQYTYQQALLVLRREKSSLH